MQKTTLAVLLNNKNGVLIPSQITPQYTGVMDENSFYGKRVYGTGPLFIQVPDDKTREATHEYSSEFAKDFKIKELIFSEPDNLESLKKFSIITLDSKIIDEIDESINLQNKLF